MKCPICTHTITDIEASNLDITFLYKYKIDLLNESNKNKKVRKLDKQILIPLTIYKCSYCEYTSHLYDISEMNLLLIQKLKYLPQYKKQLPFLYYTVLSNSDKNIYIKSIPSLTFPKYQNIDNPDIIIDFHSLEFTPHNKIKETLDSMINNANEKIILFFDVNPSPYTFSHFKPITVRYYKYFINKIISKYKVTYIKFDNFYIITVYKYIKIF